MEYLVWNTDNELGFLRRAGLNRRRSDDLGAGPERRARILRGYFHGSGYRVNWGDIDRGKVIDYVQKELADLV